MTSTLSAEHRIMGTRAKLILLVFAFLALGTLTAAVVYVILLDAFKSAIMNDLNRLQWVWRLLLGLGIVPALFTLYARLRMKETEPYEKCRWFNNPVVLDTGLLINSVFNRRGQGDQSHGL